MEKRRGTKSRDKYERIKRRERTKQSRRKGRKWPSCGGGVGGIDNDFDQGELKGI